MYCPRCSQQQTTEDVSYCTRCGFQLGPVRELLGVGAVQQMVQPAGRWPRRRRLRLGAKVMFFSGVLFPMFLALSLAVDSPEPLVPPLVLFLAGLAFMLYSWIFFEDASPVASKTTITFPGVTAAPRGLQSPAPPASLAPGTFEELPVRRANTAEIIHPPSVTERTTNLLEKATD